MDAGTLHIEVAKVCPILGVSVGVADERATWKIHPKPEATQEQIDAGQNVIETVPINYTAPEYRK